MVGMQSPPHPPATRRDAKWVSATMAASWAPCPGCLCPARHCGSSRPHHAAPSCHPAACTCAAHCRRRRREDSLVQCRERGAPVEPPMQHACPPQGSAREPRRRTRHRSCVEYVLRRRDANDWRGARPAPLGRAARTAGRRPIRRIRGCIRCSGGGLPPKCRARQRGEGGIVREEAGPDEVVALNGDSAIRR